MQCEVLYTDVETEKQRRGTRSCESRESEASTNPPEDFEDPLAKTDDVAYPIISPPPHCHCH